MRIQKHIQNILAGCSILMMFAACNGILGDIYDEPSDVIVAKEGQVVLDATSWKDWYYLDFDNLDSTTTFTAYPVPTEEFAAQNDSKTGIYTYWYDVWDKGLSVNEFRSFMPTRAQEEPDNWSIAIHRNNVRTNGGAVLETNYTSMDQLPAQSSSFMGATFTEDEWSEKDVWVDQSQMLQNLIGNQGIRINKVLSSWLGVEIPPMPPKFVHNNHVFIVKLKNGRYAALQLENYMNAKGTKCWLTINYKYPY